LSTFSEDLSGTITARRAQSLQCNAMAAGDIAALDRTARIAIVGGGIGGLTFARALQLQGFERVEVLEQWAEVKVRGGHIGCRPAEQGGALGVLETLGLLRQVEAVAPSARGTLQRMCNGREIAVVEDYHLGPRIMRETLQHILLESVAPGTVRFGAGLRDIRERADHVELSLEDGAAGRYDLVVAADGINSVVAQKLWPDESSKDFAGFVTYVCMAEGAFVPANTWYDNFVDCGDHGFCVRCLSGFGASGRRDMAGFVVRSDTPVSNSWDAEGTKEQVHAFLDAMEARGCRPEWLSDLVEKSERVWRWGIFEHAPKRSWISPGGRTVLLGDAAHAMAPFLGLGAQAAMLDAEALAEELARGRPLADALREYEARRKGPCEQVQANAKFEGRLITSCGATAAYWRAALPWLLRVQVGLLESPRPYLQRVGSVLRHALVLGHGAVERVGALFGSEGWRLAQKTKQR